MELLFELAGQVSLGSMQVTNLCQQELPCFALFSIFSTPPSFLPSYFLTHSSWRSFDELQSICPCFESVSGKAAGLSGRPAKPSIVQELGDTGGSPFYHFPHFSTDIFEMQPLLQCFTPVSNYVTAPVLSTHATACRQRRKQVICIQSKYFVITCCSS